MESLLMNSMVLFPAWNPRHWHHYATPQSWWKAGGELPWNRQVLFVDPSEITGQAACWGTNWAPHGWTTLLDYKATNHDTEAREMEWKTSSLGIAGSGGRTLVTGWRAGNCWRFLDRFGQFWGLKMGPPKWSLSLGMIHRFRAEAEIFRRHLMPGESTPN